LSQTSTTKSPIGFWTLVCLVVANMIGGAIYSSSCFSLADLGSARLVLFVWLIAGILAVCGAIGYGALASRLPFSGGEYLYLSRLVHPSVGFLAGWISLVAGFTAPIAYAAKLVGEYALPKDMATFEYKGAVATIAIIVAALLHAWHVKIGAWFQNGIVATKLVFLTLFLVVAVSIGPTAGWQSGELASATLKPDASLFQTLNMVFSALVWVVLAYTGFNASVYLAGEVPCGDRRVPRSMWLATLIVTFFYLALNAVFLYAIPPEKIAGNTSFVADVARAIGGQNLEWLMRFAIVLSQVTSVFAMLMTGPRVYAQMANDGVMPKVFVSRGGIPRVAIFIQALLSIIVVWMSTLESLLSYLGLTLTVCGAMAIASGWMIRRRYPEAEPLRWYEHGAMAVFVISSIGLLFIAWQFKPEQFYISVGTFAVGILLYGVSVLLQKPVGHEQSV
jgi:amino acid transporter